mmetsp:Transcript_18211/g.25223  ORF Transcript_18211/g.25223 Transcript_18211/m.25223 type:complete len:256 (-) Transcript_18211:2831-3598(-)
MTSPSINSTLDKTASLAKHVSGIKSGEPIWKGILASNSCDSLAKKICLSRITLIPESPRCATCKRLVPLLMDASTMVALPGMLRDGPSWDVSMTWRRSTEGESEGAASSWVWKEAARVVAYSLEEGPPVSDHPETPSQIPMDDLASVEEKKQASSQASSSLLGCVIDEAAMLSCTAAMGTGAGLDWESSFLLVGISEVPMACFTPPVSRDIPRLNLAANVSFALITSGSSYVDITWRASLRCSLSSLVTSWFISS